MKITVNRFVIQMSEYLRKFCIPQNEENKFEYLLEIILKDFKEVENDINNTTSLISWWIFKNKYEEKKGIVDKKEYVNVVKKELITFFGIGEKNAGDFLDDLILSKDVAIDDNFKLILKDNFECNIKSSMVNSIINLCSRLEKMGVMYKLLNISNSYYRREGLEKLILNLENLQVSYSRDFLEKQNLLTLSLLFIFWVNKFSKAIEALMNFLMLIGDSVPKLVGITKGDVDEKIIEFWLVENSETSKYIDWLRLWSINEELVTNDYKDYEIFKSLKKFNNLKNETYVAKEITVLLALMLSHDSKHIKNFGLCKKDEMSNMIIVSWDVPRYNMPVRVHIDKRKYEYAYKMMINKKIHIYIGDDDFNDAADKKFLGTSVIYELTESQKKDLLDYNKTTKKKSLMHLAFIQTNIWPEYLKALKNEERN